MSRPNRKVVIVGGGFAGIEAAKRLGKCDCVDVIMIDKSNHHVFQPLLYQVAMAGLDPSDIASPIRSILSSYRNVRTLLAKVTGVDVQQRLVYSDAGKFEFDYLLVACGAVHSYFGNDQWEPHAPGLKSLPQATEIRRRVLLAFEQAERTDDPTEQDHWMTFVIVGGGPTGVELAGAIAEMARYTLKRDFRSIDASLARVILVQAGERILEQFPDDLSEYSKQALESIGVEVRLGDQVTRVTDRGVQIGDHFLDARTVIWAAGVQASPLGKSLGVPTDRSGRVMVEPDLSIPGHPNVFVAGDMASANDEDGKGLPGLAPVAIQQGRYLGELISREAQCYMIDRPAPERSRFKYLDKGQMATIGRRRAVAQSGRFKLTGRLAWMAWLLIHIAYLNGFRNRTFVFLSWAWSYLTFARGARLIVPKNWRITKTPAPAKTRA
ncbi:NAD(P)/FAD-dependent oxidoreductase [Stieleria sp. ICT_E10.1]|uniref:NAD(P)/FAD-dependent oxidoreductase n=1 Tax=Stieleria sedimenti TaxID=2976331 RepID=UPI00217FC3CE|nr:NAD(P)/FAD-dependent oxidoreductase [Stieleria sedimenti]MCS7466077.1 NAD(P)/FAD-dependent oxidoreductase [Stieleria sedimenti]